MPPAADGSIAGAHIASANIVAAAGWVASSPSSTADRTVTVRRIVSGPVMGGSDRQGVDGRRRRLHRESCERSRKQTVTVRRIAVRVVSVMAQSQASAHLVAAADPEASRVDSPTSRAVVASRTCSRAVIVVRSPWRTGWPLPAGSRARGPARSPRRSRFVEPLCVFACSFPCRSVGSDTPPLAAGVPVPRKLGSWSFHRWCATAPAVFGPADRPRAVPSGRLLGGARSKYSTD